MSYLSVACCLLIVTCISLGGCGERSRVVGENSEYTPEMVSEMLEAERKQSEANREK